ncbi:uncharacterized protein LOC129278343 [Lytechinus pictus]|uniref:uncharacterized protein LOC129278343 n=1 Tax=Lytechinus pictus TaxID=7653 RepID=UPI00240E8394|nr:uncharacterized protein LOC129278343 [Lytechinus pictus]
MNILSNKEGTLDWLREKKLITLERSCPVCDDDMRLTETRDRYDGLKWTCKKRKGVDRHSKECSIRKDSWFENSNLSLPETVKFTYWWCMGISQKLIIQQLQLSDHTSVDWAMFCREVCLESLNNQQNQLGGPGKFVEIDECKIGKRKYNRGHIVEGQWVFGGIERDSRRSFLFAVEDRSEKTLLRLILQRIAPETTIISDCWKSYSNLSKHGYQHETVNHSVEFKNANGYHTNTIEGHWRHLKASLPQYSRKKEHYESYLAEFLYRYQHTDEEMFLSFIDDVAKMYNKTL